MRRIQYGSGRWGWSMILAVHEDDPLYHWSIRMIEDDCQSMRMIQYFSSPQGWSSILLIYEMILNFADEDKTIFYWYRSLRMIKSDIGLWDDPIYSWSIRVSNTYINGPWGRCTWFMVGSQTYYCTTVADLTWSNI